MYINRDYNIGLCRLVLGHCYTGYTIVNTLTLEQKIVQYNRY